MISRANDRELYLIFGRRWLTDFGYTLDEAQTDWATGTWLVGSIKSPLMRRWLRQSWLVNKTQIILTQLFKHHHCSTYMKNVVVYKTVLPFIVFHIGSARFYAMEGP